MSMPSDRYSASVASTAETQTRLSTFRATVSFDLDDFQTESCRALEDGHSVLVAAPTGSGKTIVGEFAVYLALEHGLKAFYTTPIKALSNQKYTELAARYGQDRVGLLTGDTSINSEADVVVMTTEVLRNMLYANSTTLDALGYVIMDEVHYLADRFRGAVWEEVIIHLPEQVRLVSLSATVSNAEEFGAWLDTVRGQTKVIVTEHRPVPLWQHVMAGRQMLDLFAADVSFDEAAPVPLESGDTGDAGDSDAPQTRADQRFEVNPELLSLARKDDDIGRGRPGSRRRGSRGGYRRGGPPHRDRAGSGRGTTPRRPSRPAVIAQLDREGLLPAITFIFSRAGCDAAVQQCVDADLWLTGAQQRRAIRRRVDEAATDLPEEDLTVLGFWSWREGLIRGIAAHHAGMLPTFKEVVEDLFSDGLVKAVFATETLALGVNMPARSVVLEKLDKFNGESHVDITAGEYTQLTGRAGRRGIDVEGHAVVLWQPGTDPAAVAGLASRRTYPLHSSFRPTYNMSINLLSQFGRVRARDILESSFAQFQADRSVVGIARQVRSREESLAGYEQSMTCHLGDFAEYARLRRELSDAESRLSKVRARMRRSAAAESLRQLHLGDVVDVPAGRSPGYAVVIAPDGGAREPRPTVLTDARQIRRIGGQDLAGALEPLSHIRIPKSFNARNPKSRRDLASSMRNALHDHRPARPGTGSPGAESPGTGSAGVDGHRTGGSGGGTERQERAITDLRRRLRAHPCHGCDDREHHARWAERWWKLRGETDSLMHQIQGRTNTIAKTFDRVCDVLSGYGYVHDDASGAATLSPDGHRLRRIYGDKDLLTALCLGSGAFDGLDDVELAAFVSGLVFHARREEQGVRPKMPTPALEAAVDVVVRQWSQLTDTEAAHRLPQTAEPDLGLVWPMYKWAHGRHLTSVLSGTTLAAGDFVRWAKQVIDLLDQLAQVPEAPPGFGLRCRKAIDNVRRGVVAYSAVSD